MKRRKMVRIRVGLPVASVACLLLMQFNELCVRLSGNGGIMGTGVVVWMRCA